MQNKMNNSKSKINVSMLKYSRRCCTQEDAPLSNFTSHTEAYEWWSRQNAVTRCRVQRRVKDAYPLPNIDGVLSWLGDTYFILAVDSNDTSWQIPLISLRKPKTAFTILGWSHYQFGVMSFGLCNAAQSMCRLMDRVIPSELIICWCFLQISTHIVNC